MPRWPQSTPPPVPPSSYVLVWTRNRIASAYGHLEWTPETHVVSPHPLLWIKDEQNRRPDYEVVLAQWQQLTDIELLMLKEVR
jgi:hypothetical protein